MKLLITTKIFYFANFCNKIHIKGGCENQGCNLSLLVKQFVYYTLNNSFDERKIFFIDHYFNNRDIMQSLFFLHKNQDHCF